MSLYLSIFPYVLTPEGGPPTGSGKRSVDGGGGGEEAEIKA